MGTSGIYSLSNLWIHYIAVLAIVTMLYVIISPYYFVASAEKDSFRTKGSTEDTWNVSGLFYFLYNRSSAGSRPLVFLQSSLIPNCLWDLVWFYHMLYLLKCGAQKWCNRCEGNTLFSVFFLSDGLILSL